MSLAEEPLSLEQELSEFMVKDGYGGGISVAFDDDKFAMAMEHIAAAVTRICERMDRGKACRSPAELKRWRARIKARIAEHPGAKMEELRQDFGAYGALVSQLRKELALEGKIVKIGRKYEFPGDGE